MFFTDVQKRVKSSEDVLLLLNCSRIPLLNCSSHVQKRVRSSEDVLLTQGMSSQMELDPIGLFCTRAGEREHIKSSIHISTPFLVKTLD